MKINLKEFFLSLLLVWAFLGANPIVAQMLNKPVPAVNPNFGGTSPWYAACGKEGLNDYYVSFNWMPPLVGSDNEFILELSDATGSFSSPVELSKVTDKNTDFNFLFQFSLPEDTRGDAYRFRVRSTKPVKTSPVSDVFPMYYMDITTTLQIRETGDGATPPSQKVELCNGATATLEVYNIPNAETYRYIWYRNTTPYPLGGHGPSIEVSEAGYYVVEIDYGDACSGNSTQSLSIEVSLGTSVGLALIPPPVTTFCPGASAPPLQANINNPAAQYTWYRDGQIVQPATLGAHTYTVDTQAAQFAGAYTVKIQGYGLCTETSAPVVIAQAGDFEVGRDNPAQMILAPGITVPLSVTANVTPVTYQWYKDNVAIPGAISKTYPATTAGVYYAEVAMSGGSCPTAVKKSASTTVSLPSSFELVLGYATDYTDCSNTSVVLEVSQLWAVLPDGSKTDVTTQLGPSFSYGWIKDGMVVPGNNSANLSLTVVSENGAYQVTGTLGSFTTVSNALGVKLQGNEVLTISSTLTVLCNPDTPALITTPLDLTGESFRWTRNGADLPIQNEVLEVTEVGSYRLIITRDGCDLVSNIIEILPLDDSGIVLSTGTNEILFPEGGSRTISVSGGESYLWFDAQNVLLSQTDSVLLTEEGDYIVVATRGGCQITKSFSVIYQDTFAVPNVVTANGDGYNDLWVLPNIYTRDPEVNVIIYNHKGEEVLNQFQYKNNWPEASQVFPQPNMIFYYIIKNAKQTLKKGTITVIR